MLNPISDVNINDVDSAETSFVDTNVLLAVHFDLSRWNASKKNWLMPNLYPHC